MKFNDFEITIIVKEIICTEYKAKSYQTISIYHF